MRILTLIALLNLLPASAWASSPAIPFNIAAGEFPQAIVEFGKQSRVEILYASPASVAELRTRAVKGTFTTAEALAKLLEGTGFAFEFENEHSILLRRTEHSTGSAVAHAREAATATANGESALEISDLKPGLDELLVTGTYLHGVLDVMSPMVSVSRREVAASPYATVQDALQGLPLNSLSARSETFGGNGNFNLGAAPNLRGLGYGATLVLVNGQRQPAAGISADFVDISNIPWSIVDHIEVLPDGASALYGSDAIAGVVNVILRDSIEGGETTLRSGIGSDSANERLVAQLWGHNWSTGRLLLAYQYSQRTSLSAADRPYTANADKRPLGGDDFRTVESSPGNILNPDTFLPEYAIPNGQNGRSLLSTELLHGAVNLQNQFAAYELAPQKALHNAFFSASQQLSERIELFAESRFSHRASEYLRTAASQTLSVPTTNAFYVDPFARSEPLWVAYNFMRDLGPVEFASSSSSHLSSLGIETTLPRDWRARLMTSYGREQLDYTASNLVDQEALDVALGSGDRHTAFNPFGDGSGTNRLVLESIRSQQSEHAQSTLLASSLIADGRLFELPSGAVKLALGIERRSEILERENAAHQRFSRDTASTFAELSLPLIGRPDDSRAIPSLELSLAGRFEDYSDFGNTFNPRVGLRWVPAKWLKLRGSFGTSFRAPRLVDLYDSSDNASTMGIIPDPQSPTGQSVFLALQGSNPDLKQETARTWTAGMDLLAPSGMALSLTYFAIDYQDQIVQPGPPSPFEILIQEKYWAPVIQRAPTRDQIEAVCHREDFLASLEQCLQSSPASIIDIRLRNLSRTRSNGMDVALAHDFDSDIGLWRWQLDGTYMFRLDRFLTRTTPTAHLLDTVGNPVSFRFRAIAEWNQRREGGLGAAVATHYTGSYQDGEGSTQRTVAAWTTMDLQLRYRISNTVKWLDGVEFSLNAANVLDAAPPFVNRSIGFDQFNSLPYGRVISLAVEKSW